MSKKHENEAVSQKRQSLHVIKTSFLLHIIIVERNIRKTERGELGQAYSSRLHHPTTPQGNVVRILVRSAESTPWSRKGGESGHVCTSLSSPFCTLQDQCGVVIVINPEGVFVALNRIESGQVCLVKQPFVSHCPEQPVGTDRTHSCQTQDDSRRASLGMIPFFIHHSLTPNWQRKGSSSRRRKSSCLPFRSSPKQVSSRSCTRNSASTSRSQSSAP